MDNEIERQLRRIADALEQINRTISSVGGIGGLSTAINDLGSRVVSALNKVNSK